MLPDDIEHAFALLKDVLYCRAEELSASTQKFFIWLQKYLTETQTDQFTALDICRAKQIHPRTLNRYLQELTRLRHIQIAGGNKYHEGYQYRITKMNEYNALNKSIEAALKKAFYAIKCEFSKKQ